jgi:single-stranded DNA-binding protein
MNRWTGTGHLTRDPKFLETENGTAICTLRIAVKRAGKQSHDGYFDVKCFDAQASSLTHERSRTRSKRSRLCARWLRCPSTDAWIWR